MQYSLNSKLQTSVSALENMHRDKTGISFVKQHHGREKVLVLNNTWIYGWFWVPFVTFNDHISWWWSLQILKGQLYVDAFRERQLYSFLDYISSGFELNFMVAVDFTGM